MAENSKVDVYSVYVKKFFRAIPKNSVLITRDPNFNGNYVKVKKGGFAFVRPWAESKFIYVGIQNRDYEKMEFDEDFNINTPSYGNNRAKKLKIGESTENAVGIANSRKDKNSCC